MHVATMPRAKATSLSRQVTAGFVVFGGGLALLAVLALIHVLQGQAGLDWRTVVDALVAPDGRIEHQIVRYSRLPRVAVGVLAGVSLGMAGVLFQAVTRNPLASPSTLGVNAGAYLAVILSTLYAPGLFGWSPLAIAFVGAGLAGLGVFVMASGAGATPTRLALAGMATTLALAAVTATLQLFHEGETMALFFWGAGSLMQKDWSGAVYAWPRIALGAVAALAIARSLDVLTLGDDVARALGQRVRVVQFGATVIGIFLAAAAVAVTGPIGFVGLVAPHLVRMIGLQGHRWVLPGAAVWGAVLLVGADVAGRAATRNVTEVPAGIVTALIGAPFFVWLARRSARPGDGAARGRESAFVQARRRLPPYPAVVAGAAVLLVVVLMIGTAVGDVSLGLRDVLNAVRGEGSDLAHRIVVGQRLPRLLVATVAGACLAVSGVLIQGVVRNPLAAPEIVGVTPGAGLAAIAALVVLPDAPASIVPVAAFIGAFAAFGLVYAVSWRGGISPARLALVGTAVAAFAAAGINLLAIRASLGVASALVWISGTTYGRGWDDLVRLAPWAVVLLPVAWFGARWLDVLALGDDVPRGLGMRLERARGALLVTGVALAAGAVATVGTIAFVGLVAPHASRLMAGGRGRRLVPVAALVGAILVASADTVGRVAMAPKEIPSGLVTSLIGAPYFLWLLWRSRKVSG